MPIVENQVCNAPGKSDCGFNGHWRPFVSRLRLDYCHQSLYLQYTSNLLKNIICLFDRTRVPSLSNLVNYRVSQKKYLSKISGSEMHKENLDRFGPCQIILDHFYTLDHFGPFGPFWTVLDRLDHLDHFGPFGPFWTNWTILDP